MKMEFKVTLQHELVSLHPLVADDFESMFSVASDPEIWAQHPYKNRWQKDVYLEFFNASLNSNGAFKIIDRRSGEFIGGTRFYEYNEEESSIAIGGTFYATKYWGSGINRIVKELMLDYMFHYVTCVFFYIDQNNKRSQVAIERLGASRTGEKPVGDTMLDFVYCITKEEWALRK